MTDKQQESLLDINLSNARSENESYEDYRNRLKTNKQILKTYRAMGREAFREMFPGGVASAIQQAQPEVESDQRTETVQIPGSLHIEDE